MIVTAIPGMGPRPGGVAPAVAGHEQAWKR